MSDAMSITRPAARRVGHIASNQRNGGMLGQTLNVAHQFHDAHRESGGGLFGNVAGLGGDVGSGVKHIAQIASDPGRGVMGLAGDAVSAVKHGMGAVKGAAPYLPAIASAAAMVA
jgi:hypothetical protein